MALMTMTLCWWAQHYSSSISLCSDLQCKWISHNNILDLILSETLRFLIIYKKRIIQQATKWVSQLNIFPELTFGFSFSKKIFPELRMLHWEFSWVLFSNPLLPPKKTLYRDFTVSWVIKKHACLSFPEDC